MSGRPVEPPSPDAKRTFKVVKAFRALAPAQGWELLISRESALAELEAETRRGTFAAAMPASDEHLSPVLQSIRREKILARSELGDRLRELVGPLAPATDPLVKSRAAFAFAMSHLADVDEAASR
jgi:hypothetical protein